MPDDAQRRVLITGVSRGLGRAMVQQFVVRGHTVLGCARSERGVHECRERFGAPHSFDVVDVADDKAVAQWARRVLQDVGVPDLLVNNAALIHRNAPLWQIPPDEFSQVLRVNIAGVYHVIRHFVPAMIERRRGVIANFSSYWGRSVSPEVSLYCATKWAIEGLTRALAEELPHGMAAVPLNPGIIHTEMLQSCFGSQAAAYPDPETWAKKAVPFLLQLSGKDNGKPLTVPGF